MFFLYFNFQHKVQITNQYKPSKNFTVTFSSKQCKLKDRMITFVLIFNFFS